MGTQKAPTSRDGGREGEFSDFCDTCGMDTTVMTARLRMLLARKRKNFVGSGLSTMWVRV